MLSGRMVDAYSNIQTLRLFGRDDANDRYMRQGFDIFQRATMTFTRFITGVRASMALLSGVMITSMAALCIDLWLSGKISSGAVAFTLALVLRLNFLLGRLMTQFNGIMRNFGTVQNAAELISQPIGLVDAPDAVMLEVKNRAFVSRMSVSTMAERTASSTISISTSGQGKRSASSDAPARENPPSSICCCGFTMSRKDAFSSTGRILRG